MPLRRTAPPLPPLPFLLSLLLLLAPISAYSQSNGMDPAMDMPMSLAHGQMTSFLHSTPGDILWLDGWVPGRGRTLLGACVGLFLLGIAERWVAAVRAGMEGAIRRELDGMAHGRTGERRKSKTQTIPPPPPPPLRDVLLMRGGTVAPFVAEHAWARFVLQAAQAALGILFMLAVMTFQVAFILSIAIGLGVGEGMYGRFVDAVYAGRRAEDEVH